VRTQQVSAQQLSTEVPVQALRPGVYFLTVRSANKVEVQRFVKN
jgi:hypothetical protein